MRKTGNTDQGCKQQESKIMGEYWFICMRGRIKKNNGKKNKYD
jgi:hypothetical protein